MSWGSAALLSLYDELDLLDSFEVARYYLLQKRLKNLVCHRSFEVQQNLSSILSTAATVWFALARALPSKLLS